MLEDNMYWIAIQARWLDDANFARGPALFFREVPWPIRPAIQAMVRRGMHKRLHAHGMGRHTLAEQVAILSKSLESLSAILGNKSYLLGERPCGADATFFSFMAGRLCSYFDTPMRTETEKYANIVSYVERMRDMYYPSTELGLERRAISGAHGLAINAAGKSR